MNSSNGPSALTLTEDGFHSQIHSAIGKPYHAGKAQRREHAAKWATSVVHASLKTISIQVLVDFKSSKLSEAEHDRLARLACEGISKYWSRSISVAGQLFAVAVTASHRTGSSLPVVLKIEKNAKYGRSYNPGVLGIDARFIYNQGTFSGSKELAEADFKLVCAHEFGHSVLKTAGGLRLSWGHKGSTGALTQSVKNTTEGYPQSGPIDLMKYYDDGKQRVSFRQLTANSVASENDVKRLIWGSTIQWRN